MWTSDREREANPDGASLDSSTLRWRFCVPTCGRQRRNHRRRSPAPGRARRATRGRGADPGRGPWSGREAGSWPFPRTPTPSGQSESETPAISLKRSPWRSPHFDRTSRDRRLLLGGTTDRHRVLASKPTAGDQSPRSASGAAPGGPRCARDGRADHVHVRHATLQECPQGPTRCAIRYACRSPGTTSAPVNQWRFFSRCPGVRRRGSSS